MYEIPFGYHYSGDNLSIKLRIKLENWKKAPVEKSIGTVRYAKTGYVIFSCVVKAASEEAIYTIEQLRKQKEDSA